MEPLDERSCTHTDNSTFEFDEPRKKIRPLPPGKDFHVFLSYRDIDEDKQWVQKLKNELEKNYNFKCCDHILDFQPGMKIVENIKLAVTRSVKTIIILSKEYQNSYWCNFEVDFTHHLSMEMKEKIIIPVLKEDCDIPDHLKPFTYIDARNEIATWLPRLVAAIELPVEDLFNRKIHYGSSERYRNLDTVYEESSKCGCGTLPFQTTRYVPDALNNASFNLNADLYTDILEEISKAPLFKFRHLCLPWCPNGCCIIGLLAVLFLFFTIALVSVIQAYNKDTTNDIHFPTTTSSTPQDTKTGPVSGLVFTIVYILLTLTWPFACCCFVYKKRKWMNKTLVSVNRKLIDHNLLVTYKIRKWTATIKVVFIYFNMRPCLEHIESRLRYPSRIDLPMLSDQTELKAFPVDRSTTDDEEMLIADFQDDATDETIPKENIDQSMLSDQTEVEAFQVNTCITDGDEEILIVDFQDASNDRTIDNVENVESSPRYRSEVNQNTLSDQLELPETAEDILARLSADFIQDFMEEKLENSTMPRHTTRAICLCEYAEKKLQFPETYRDIVEV